MVTYGFYDSYNHDRRYNALQFGSIFDGICRDGIFMSIGTCFRVIPGDGMSVIVGAGRAWFNHTWTLNDAPLPMNISQSEVLLNRIDAIVIDVWQDQEHRRNDVILIKGTPSSNPQRPTMINSSIRHQYPLAYISVEAGVTSLRAADITSMVGTSVTPYVTGILETVNIDALLDQWEDQYLRFYENQTQEIIENNNYWKQEWQKWYEAQTAEIQESYRAWEQEWELWSSKYETEMTNTANKWKELWDAWFYSYVNESQQEFSNWQTSKQNEFQTWFDGLQDMLSSDAAAELANRILHLEECCEMVRGFMTDLTGEYTIKESIMDSYGNYILDSSGNDVGARTILVTK